MNASLCEQGHICPHYDTIVVGAGIAGLYVARELLKKKPTLHLALCERYKGLGGRTYSYSPPGFEGIQWEMGAGRIRKDHTLVMGLLKDYGLTWVPIGTDTSYLARNGGELVKNQFESMNIPLFLEPLSTLSAEVLATHTIKELLVKLHGAEKTAELLSSFPYRAEVNTLRADLGLSSFLGKGEMGSHEGYGVIAEGFGELVKRMRDDLEARGCTILPRHRLLDLVGNKDSSTDLTFEFGYEKDPKSSGRIVLRAEKGVVLALHKDAVAELPAFRGWKTLQHLKTQPLLRTYAVFPAPAGKSWFSGLGRIVTPEKPRYILPIDPSKGVIMISYTDADDTAEYMKIQEKGGDKVLEKQILGDVRKLFPALKIPAPLFFKSHPWKTGATYWLPGKYSPSLESSQAIHPLPKILPNVWLCGESWSLRQAWVEGALEHAKECLNQLPF
jgi:hypothetical protein